MSNKQIKYLLMLAIICLGILALTSGDYKINMKFLLECKDGEMLVSDIDGEYCLKADYRLIDDSDLATDLIIPKQKYRNYITLEQKIDPYSGIPLELDGTEVGSDLNIMKDLGSNSSLLYVGEGSKIDNLEIDILKLERRIEKLEEERE